VVIVITDPLVLLIWEEYERANQKSNAWYESHHGYVDGRSRYGAGR
jgi:hypothetical protein